MPVVRNKTTDDILAENGRLREAIGNLITTSHEEWDATIEYKEKKTLQSQERWTNALRATAEARAQARILLADEQAAPKKDDPPDGWMPDGSWSPGG